MVIISGGSQPLPAVHRIPKYALCTRFSFMIDDPLYSNLPLLLDFALGGFIFRIFTVNVEQVNSVLGTSIEKLFAAQKHRLSLSMGIYSDNSHGNKQPNSPHDFLSIKVMYSSVPFQVSRLWLSVLPCTIALVVITFILLLPRPCIRKRKVAQNRLSFSVKNVALNCRTIYFKTHS